MIHHPGDLVYILTHPGQLTDVLSHLCILDFYVSTENSVCLCDYRVEGKLCMEMKGPMVLIKEGNRYGGV